VERAALDQRDRPGALSVPVVVVTNPRVATFAVTVGLAALGADFGRDLDGAIGLVLSVATIPVVVALNIATAKGREQLAIGLLSGLGLLLGLAVAPLVADYARADPSALGAAWTDRLRDRRDLRFDPRRECHLRRRGARDLRRVHDLRLQPPSPQHPPDNAVPIAAGIFLDVFNVFLLNLDLFGSRRD